MERSASGRRGVEADEARAGEVRPLDNSIEADEQTWATGGGVGGAKGEDRGKHRRATHVPDAAPDKGVPEARLCTRRCSWDSSLAPRGGSPVGESRPPGSVRGASSNGCPYRDGSEISSWMRGRTLVSQAKSCATRQPVSRCQSSHKTSCNRILERFLMTNDPRERLSVLYFPFRARTPKALRGKASRASRHSGAFGQ